MWDLPRPGLEPVSPALAGRFSTTAPPGKPPEINLNRLVKEGLVGKLILSKNPVEVSNQVTWQYGEKSSAGRRNS